MNSNHTVDILLAAIADGDPVIVRYFAFKVLKSAFNYVLYAEVPLDGDSYAMSTLLVAATELDVPYFEGNARKGKKNGK
jgi:hypothetical protein